MMKSDQIILALDVGSSSVRCSAYKLLTAAHQDDDDDGQQGTVESILGCFAKRDLRSVQPNTGKILHLVQQEQRRQPDGDACTTNDGDDEDDRDDDNNKCKGTTFLFDDIDDCVDETLQALRTRYNHRDFIVVGVGCSSFVMNLIGTDTNGQPVGSLASMSYACNDFDVVRYCRSLKRYVVWV